MEDLYYIYRHIRPDKNEPFYIGRGKASVRDMKNRTFTRSKSYQYRSSHWHNIVNLNKDIYKIDILIESDDFIFINKKEIEFIALYGRRDLEKGTLVNLTDGGDGASNISPSVREELRRNRIGEKNPFYGKKHSDETRKRMSGRTGDKCYYFGKHLSETAKNKISIAKKGKSVNNKQVINLLTGDIFNSAKEVALLLNIPYSTLRARLNGCMKNNTNFKYM